MSKRKSGGHAAESASPPEKEYSCRFHRRTNLTVTSLGTLLIRSGDLASVQIAELAKIGDSK